ncbi:MAG: hypothetical protein QM695_03575 [Micropruina sp.]
MTKRRRGHTDTSNRNRPVSSQARTRCTWARAVTSMNTLRMGVTAVPRSAN